MVERGENKEPGSQPWVERAENRGELRLFRKRGLSEEELFNTNVQEQNTAREECIPIIIRYLFKSQGKN